jgi:hypothetical protein
MDPGMRVNQFHLGDRALVVDRLFGVKFRRKRVMRRRRDCGEQHTGCGNRNN